MQVKIFPRSVLVGRYGLSARAKQALCQNDMGVDEAASDLYPHQWCSVELGQQLHRHRVGAPRYRSRGPRAAHAF